MSSFTEPLNLEPSRNHAGRALWRTTRPLSYEIGYKGSGLAIEVPVGFETDLGSVPRILWPLFPPHDPQIAAAYVLHDHLLRIEDFASLLADAVLYEAMTVLGVSRWKRLAIYLPVRAWQMIRPALVRAGLRPARHQALGL